MPSDPDAFRNLATVMAYDSGVEAGRAAERARVVQDATQTIYLTSDEYAAMYHMCDYAHNLSDDIGQAFHDVWERCRRIKPTAAPSGHTTEGA